MSKEQKAGEMQQNGHVKLEERHRHKKEAGREGVCVFLEAHAMPCCMPVPKGKRREREEVSTMPLAWVTRLWLQALLSVPSSTTRPVLLFF